MKVIATNIGEKRKINYKGLKITTGIYKYPVHQGIYLESMDVKNDVVVDRESHGGIDKACYLYSFDVYSYWKQLHPNLEWDYGMFGENITVEGLNELEINIGAKYKLGDAVIEVSQPRQPCIKFGIRMETQTILKQFINTTYSGAYVRVLQNGHVKPQDHLELIEAQPNNPTVAEAFYCLYQPEIKRSMIDKLLNCDALAESCKRDIKSRLR